MDATVRRDALPADVEAALRAEGGRPSRWGNGPGHRYDWHVHGDRKVLFCLRGSIVFHLHDAPDLELRPGDRLDLPAGTDHAASVGPDGVECIEALIPPSLPG